MVPPCTPGCIRFEDDDGGDQDSVMVRRCNLMVRLYMLNGYT